MLIAIIVMSIVAALAMPLLLGARAIVRADQLRTATNQGVRAASDIIGTDIRMAGERFPLSSSLPLPPIEIIAGGSDPDEIILRRNLWEATFPICADIQTNHSAVRVVRPDTWIEAATYPECIQPVNGAGWPANLSDVLDLANSIGQGGVLRGYIFDPPLNRGEFFDFQVLGDANTTHLISKVSGAFQFSYGIANRPRIYILEERHYRLQGGILELVVNETTPLRVASEIANLRALHVLDDGSLSATLGSGKTWRDIQSVEITVTARQTEGPEVVERSLTTRYFPRNVMSR